MPVDLNENILVSLHVVQKLFSRIKIFYSFLTSYLYQWTKRGQKWTICNKFKKTILNVIFFPKSLWLVSLNVKQT